MTGRDELLAVIVNRNENYVKANPYLKGYYYYLLNNKSIKTVDVYLHIIHDFIETVGKTPEELILDDFNYYMMKCRVKQNGEPTTNSFIITRYHAIKTYSKYLFISKTIKEDYMQMIPRPKTQDSQQTILKREISYLDKTEIKVFLDAVRTGVGTAHAKKLQAKWRTRDYSIMLVFLTTGIRVSALAALDVNDVNFEKNELWVTDKGNKVKCYQLNQVTIQALKAWMVDRNVLANFDENGLFVTQYGVRMMPEAYRELVKKYAVDINGKHITPHKLRATYGTQLYEATNDIYFVQKAMGHSSPTVTERYIRGQGNVTAQASDIMSDLI